MWELWQDASTRVPFHVVVVVVVRVSCCAYRKPAKSGMIAIAANFFIRYLRTLDRIPWSSISLLSTAFWKLHACNTLREHDTFLFSRPSDVRRDESQG